MIAAAALGFVLLFAVPAAALWRSWSKRPSRSQASRYRATITRAFALLLALLVVSRLERISPAELGIGTHLGVGGWIGLAIAIAVVGGLTIAMLMTKADPKKVYSRSAEAMMPKGQREARLFLFLVPLIGFAWELLYRGYLLWWLTPLVGTPVAVLSASAAYGLAHGWKNVRESLPSLISAFLFTTGYALTRSLWWLIIIHMGLPLIGYLEFRRARGAIGGGQELEAA
ncbi:MAG TPA: CPBP family intramembrane glutamic endopeptidase [Sphingomicrobium sp.]|nr:CPBP family intramembrane glutamic endopeptidase [Sphingomicrobium sp.]